MPQLSPVATLVLSLLRERPMHPYEILGTLRARRSDQLVRLSPGAVYHAVERLEADGLVASQGTDRAGNRPERTTYALTQTGRDALADRVRELIGDRSPEYLRLPVGLSLAHDLPLADAVAHLRNRRDDLAAEVEAIRAKLDMLLTRGLPRRFLLDVEHRAHMLGAERDWLDDVLGDLTTGALSWDALPPDDYPYPADPETA
ncbi:transcriptional regulator, PadR-like family [Beutenbergia cavernae DSM 12333]|uniref:Transcriptional regulator, PadR-like family n=1 Tax=Beutenbergia cavernae (strain ATCC BAA-8 / DSM 12333 / CCUG 43141 / JCM 11478 / NBRC 16432 / NCIMB 13614 / HKI 0122) TaxID=471853 RepID=C5C3L8_BEUC1|nr:PadR family transcriptional regulator [Beutenbergia cavernae]ACQ81927.1 transcriptional regulator, PadR-like family [Beutenbergia cavernae DSM 12333]